MGRPKWTPKTDQQRDAIDNTKKAAERVKEAERDLWKTVSKARDEGVPTSYLADTLGVDRATVYRNLPE
jgi:DNA invertase Pin-like site-specific DNA recombinase